MTNFTDTEKAITKMDLAKIIVTADLGLTTVVGSEGTPDKMRLVCRYLRFNKTKLFELSDAAIGKLKELRLERGIKC